MIKNWFFDQQKTLKWGHFRNWKFIKISILILTKKIDSKVLALVVQKLRIVKVYKNYPLIRNSAEAKTARDKGEMKWESNLNSKIKNETLIWKLKFDLKSVWGNETECCEEKAEKIRNFNGRSAKKSIIEIVIICVS